MSFHVSETAARCGDGAFVSYDASLRESQHICAKGLAVTDCATAAR